ncbi:MAG: hypothetical protein JNK02_00315 [Planctomycetes bacterium]|nr:hypothetical protein [Planctomycetota bacterium]
MSAHRIEQRTADGSSTLSHPAHGQTYHSLDGAWTQARERYARGARLAERAHELARLGRARLRLLDVGTGLGLNLAAALEALEGTGVVLVATSLERDAALLEQVAREPREPESLERRHAHVRAAIRAALQAPGAVNVPLAGGTLALRVGDARETLLALPEYERFDAVFLDPFSPRVEPELWSRDFLAAVAGRMAPGSALATYSAAVEVRAALAAAGLRVGLGARVGRKREGTLASPDLDLPALPPRSARRVARRASAGTGGFAAGDAEGAAGIL